MVLHGWPWGEHVPYFASMILASAIVHRLPLHTTGLRSIDSIHPSRSMTNREKSTSTRSLGNVDRLSPPVAFEQGMRLQLPHHGKDILRLERRKLQGRVLVDLHGGTAQAEEDMGPN